MLLNRLECLVLVVLAALSTVCGSRVLELSDRFLDVRNEGQWFVMFYAPWCAHCKKLEPVWAHVAQALYNTNIRVGRVDCTRFTAVAQAFHVNAYPTIMFIKGPYDYTYSGERSKEELIHFVNRMSGPPVQQVTRVESIDILKSNNPIFFTYVGKQDGILWDVFYSAAEVYQPHGYFYATSVDIAKRHFDVDTVPAALVYKERSHYYFPYSDNFDLVEPAHLNESLFRWVNEERFPTFPKITRNNIHHVIQTKKYLVLAVVEENKLNEIAAHEQEFRDMMEIFVHKNKQKYHSRFQFGWVGTPDLAHSIAMDTLSTPHLIVLNASTNEHHIPEDDPLQLTPEAIEIFLDSIHNQTAPAFGGNSLPVRIYRAWFEAKTSLYDMWVGNPVLTSVLFGLPLGFLSLILYSVCCADILDADEEEEEPKHEKKE
ncbi:protein disulfide-isomerase TMX3 [Topomyia yanbarensis]|uniref:protein disulfide-isomerase TMX3 n=1 Tax=Topomyia yanbarensis TaxID=2498891 RepID=UPI00273B7BBC|nr:protein disulfide-isomerase TMX3 [Topomyia yanbarensis]